MRFHAQSAADVLTALDTGTAGLDAPEAAHRLEAQGPNALPLQNRPNPILTFLKQFHDILIYVLLASALVTLAVGDWIDASVILAVTLINALVGVIQDGRSQKALDGTRSMPH